MRTLGFILLAIFLTACASTRPYTQADLHQVRQAYDTLLPIYKAFKHDFARNDLSGMRRQYQREQLACREVDAVDKRDTINPNTRLFAASAGLDTMCNDIEMAYNTWLQDHNLPYDKSMPPAEHGAEFDDGDLAVQKLPAWLRHPSSLA